jgi:regulator of protease activity HflC (stomatin/prohibitin superfamily)
MAHITRRLFLRHLRSAPTSYVQHLRRGTTVHVGAGQSFWFRPLNAAISELPIDDRELPSVIKARTEDFQDVTVQAVVTFRIHDPAVAATRIDFSIDPSTGTWQQDPLGQLAGLIRSSAQEVALAVLSTMRLERALTEGAVLLRDRIAAGLDEDPRVRDSGVSMVGVRILSVHAEPEVERALQTPARELVQQEADRATFERRATAVQHERAIAENELQNQIELARREESLVEQRGRNERRLAEERAAAEGVAVEAEATRRRVLAAADSEVTRAVGSARADAEAAHLAANRDVDTGVLMALALSEVATHLPEIGMLNLTPDLLTPILAHLGAGSLPAGAAQ